MSKVHGVERVWPPDSWGLLGRQEHEKRVLAEFCEYCGATETQPCMTKYKTTLFNYTHHDRRQAAIKRYIAEQQERRFGDGT